MKIVVTSEIIGRPRTNSVCQMDVSLTEIQGHWYSLNVLPGFRESKR